MYSSSSDDQLIAQLEYYFSQDNLVQDHYLRSQMDSEVTRAHTFNPYWYDASELCQNHDVVRFRAGEEVHWRCHRPWAAYCNACSDQISCSSGKYYPVYNYLLNTKRWMIMDLKYEQNQALKNSGLLSETFRLALTSRKFLIYLKSR